TDCCHLHPPRSCSSRCSRLASALIDSGQPGFVPPPPSIAAVRRTAIASLRRNPLAYRANAAVKSWLLESRRRRLLRRYASAVPVSDADAFAAMRARLAERGVRLRAQSRGALNLFWVGANESQDNGGLLRGLSLFGRVEVFRSAA